MVSYEDIKNNAEIRQYIIRADESLSALGYTEHSFAHVEKVANDTAYILNTLGYSAHDIELGKIAAFLHDIGNLVNRVDHSQSGAIIAFRLLDHLGMEAADISTVVTAIGNHDEGTGVPVNPIAAALILADKADVRRTRVRNVDASTFDIHDRVNYSVSDSHIEINEGKDHLRLSLRIDTRYGSIMDYFEIFMNRMLLCRRAAERLGLRFSLIINDQVLL